MKKINLLLFVVGSLTTQKVDTAQAQMGTPRFQFSNRAQVKAAVLANLRQPRTTYDILICAGRQGMIGTAMQTYREVMGGHPFDATPEVKSAYALSHHLTLYPQLWYWKRELTPGLVRGEWSQVGEVSVHREDATAAAPRSAEVLLGEAIWLTSQGDAGTSRAFQLVERALRIAPLWADLHYWHSRILSLRAGYVYSNPDKTTYYRYERLKLRAISRAEKLDPKFLQECLLDRYCVYDVLDKPREALAAFDAYVRYRPEWINWHGERKTRARLVAEVAKLS